jgi:hypothetical protein
VAVIGSISSHSAASLPQISQDCFSRDINGYNTVPLCSVLALFTYKNTEFQALITSQLEQISKICSVLLYFIASTAIIPSRFLLTFLLKSY